MELSLSRITHVDWYSDGTAEVHDVVLTGSTKSFEYILGAIRTLANWPYDNREVFALHVLTRSGPQVLYVEHTNNLVMIGMSVSVRKQARPRVWQSRYVEHSRC